MKVNGQLYPDRFHDSWKAKTLMSGWKLVAIPFTKEEKLESAKEKMTVNYFVLKNIVLNFCLTSQPGLLTTDYLFPNFSQEIEPLKTFISGTTKTITFSFDHIKFEFSSRNYVLFIIFEIIY